MRRSLFLLLILISYTINLSAQNQQSPKVVIGIVVENMRPDYIQRYWDTFSEDGFKKLYQFGTNCNHVNLNLHTQNYASGTATLFTGVRPSTHGIVDIEWYDQLKKVEANSTKDKDYQPVVAHTQAEGASPKQLLATTVTDILKLQSLGRAKVYSVAMNRSTAIFAAGHAGDAAFWFDDKSGKMLSSTYYMKDAPEWLRQYNGKNYAEMYSFRNWSPMLDESKYTASVADDFLYEKGYFDKDNTFPHNIQRYKNKANSYRPLRTTPYANQMVKDFAFQLFENTPIGNDDITDFVTIAFSSMDYANGSFGPSSMEMQDTYLHIDKYIGEVITKAEQKYGKDNVLFFLTANTSASYPVEYLRDEFNFPVDYFSVENSSALLKPYINLKYGNGDWIIFSNNLQISLNHELAKKKKVDLDAIRTDVANFLNQFEGIQVVVASQEVKKGSSGSGVLQQLSDSFYPNRSGDILFLLREGWMPAYKYKKINYTDQSHIPLVFYGKGIMPQTISKKYNAIDLVPTLCELLQLPVPDKSVGNLIEGVVE